MHHLNGRCSFHSESKVALKGRPQLGWDKTGR